MDFRIPHGHKLCEVEYSKEVAKPKSGNSVYGEEASEVTWRIRKRRPTWQNKVWKTNRTAAGLDTRNFSQVSPLGRTEEGGKKWLSK